MRSTRSPVPAGPERAVAYESIPGIDPDLLSLDVFPPPHGCPAPVVIWVHGGRWRIGDKRNQLSDRIRLFNGAGYALVSVNYRLTDPSSSSPVRYPSHDEDVAAAVAWVHAHIGVARHRGVRRREDCGDGEPDLPRRRDVRAAPPRRGGLRHHGRRRHPDPQRGELRDRRGRRHRDHGAVVDVPRELSPPEAVGFGRSDRGSGVGTRGLTGTGTERAQWRRPRSTPGTSSSAAST